MAFVGRYLSYKLLPLIRLDLVWLEGRMYERRLRRIYFLKEKTKRHSAELVMLHRCRTSSLEEQNSLQSIRLLLAFHPWLIPQTNGLETFCFNRYMWPS